MEQDDDKAKNLLDTVRERFLDGVLGSAAAQWGHTVLILDENTIPVVDSICTVKEITSKGISEINRLQIKRQPLEQFGGIYFVAPTEKSIQAIIKDFEKPESALYHSAHLFFCRRVPRKLFRKLSQSRAVAKIKSFVEVNLDFLVPEQNVFTVDVPHSFYSLYSPDADMETTKLTHSSIAEKLVTVCATLGDYPIVRSSKHPHCKAVASIVSDGLERVRKAGLFKASTQRGTLLVLDRTHDLLSPFLHEFTYQAMAQDLVSDLEGNTYHYSYSKNDGEVIEKDVTLDGSDEIWLTTRHQHIEHARHWVAKKFKDFREKNTVLKIKAEGQEKMKKKLLDVTRSMPSYTRSFTRFAVHINLAKTCMDIFNRTDLERIASVEQDIATGKTESLKSIEKIHKRISPLLMDKSVSAANKLRLLLLYVASLDDKSGKTNATKKLIQDARLTESDELLLSNLITLKQSSQNHEQQHAPKSLNEFEFDLSRYKPVLARVLEQLLCNNLSTKEYGFLTVADEQEVDAPKVVVAKSKKRKGSKQATHRISKSSSNSPRTIVFVIGGITYSEIRSIYLAAAKHKREIIIGSSAILTPASFVKQISKLQELDESFSSDGI